MSLTRPISVGLDGYTVLAGAQNVAAPKLNFLADAVQTDGKVHRLHGHVRIAGCSVVTADDGILDLNTYEADLTGPVHLRLTTAVDKLSIK